MPSVARMSSGAKEAKEEAEGHLFSFSSRTSGSATTPDVSLSAESPKALETASTPPTRQVPAQSTAPPAASMRARSSGRLGLWSVERARAVNGGSVAVEEECSPLFFPPLPLPPPRFFLVSSSSEEEAGSTSTALLSPT